VASELAPDTAHERSPVGEGDPVVERLWGTNPMHWVAGIQQRCLLTSGDPGLVQTRLYVGALGISVSERPPAITSGAVTGDRRIVTFPMAGTWPARINGTPQARAYFSISGRGSESEVVEQVPWLSANMVFPADADFLDNWRDSNALAVFSVAEAALNPIRGIVVRALEAAVNRPECLRDDSFYAVFYDAIVLAMTELVAAPRTQLNRRSFAAALRVVRDVDAVILEVGPGHVTAVELSRAVGRSLRIIQDSLSAIKGIGLSKYLLKSRLWAARQALEAALPGTMVKKVALENGFWHLGRFAQRYREIFGESPSTTLGRRPRVSMVNQAE
jgi:methylphosphotriester-DNA--protein-cysteine methyltransferase